MSTIFCFSTTGNSLYVSKRIAEKINANVSSMSKAISSCSDDVIGFVFPVYFWGMPKIVARFVSNLQIENKNAYIFAVITYGSAAFGVTGALNKLLIPKGTSLQYSSKIKCVENYTPSFKINDTPEVQQKTESMLQIIIGEIERREIKKHEPYTFLNTLIYSKFPSHRESCVEKFIIHPNCTGCNTCVSICPVNNIEIHAEYPTFKYNCEHCLACIHACPVGALQWKSNPKDKGRYRNPHIEEKELIEFCGTACGTNHEASIE